MFFTEFQLEVCKRYAIEAAKASLDTGYEKDEKPYKDEGCKFYFAMNKLQYHSNEFFVLWNYPENKNYINGRSQSEMASLMDGEYEKYQADLKACIAGKTRVDNKELLPIQNGALGTNLIWMLPSPKLLKDGDTFDLPDNVEFEEKEGCASDCCTTDGRCGEGCREPVKFIHLKLKQEVKTIEDGGIIIPHHFSKLNAIISRAMTYLSEEDGIGKEIFDELSTLLERK